MTQHLFGQDFTFYFQPLDDDVPAVIPTALQSQTVTAYIFDSLPSRAVAAAGTGAIQTITSTSFDSAKNSFVLAVDGIDDPDPTGSTAEDTYYIGINFRLSASEQIQTAVRSFTLSRVQGSIDPLTITISDITAAYPPFVPAVATEAQTLQYIEQATSLVKAKLKAQGYQWAQLHEPKDLKLAVVYKTITIAMLVQIQQGNDKFKVKYDEFKEQYETLSEGLSFGYDGDGDGVEDSKAAPKSDMALLIR